MAKIPVLRDILFDRTCYSDTDKAEALATAFADTHDKAYCNLFRIDALLLRQTSQQKR